jgi:hypothetical protein
MNCYSDGWGCGSEGKIYLETLAMNCNGYGFGIMGVKGTWASIVAKCRTGIIGFYSQTFLIRHHITSKHPETRPNFIYFNTTKHTRQLQHPSSVFARALQ